MAEICLGLDCENVLIKIRYMSSTSQLLNCFILSCGDKSLSELAFGDLTRECV